MEVTEALSVGCVVGGSTPANGAWRAAVKALTVSVARAARDVAVPLALNVVFQVPGHILAPDFEGVRTGSYSKKAALLIVQVALPEVVPDNPLLFVRGALREAITAAERWADRRKVLIDVAALEAVVATVEGESLELP